MASQKIIFPQSPMVDIQTGYLALEWFMWFQNPQFLSIVLGTPIDVINGGTGLSSGTSGGVLGFVGSTTMASSVALTANQIVLGGGAGATPIPLGSLGTATTVLHGNAAGAPTFGAVSLTADVSGILPGANGGMGVANTGKTITLGGNLTTTPANDITFTTTGPTNVTLPTSGTIGTGTVTSVDVSGGTTGLTTSGGPITTSGTITLAGTLNVVNGGTGQTTYTNGQLLIGNTTGNTLTKATLTAGTGITITNGTGSITIASDAAVNSSLYYAAVHG